MVPRSKTRNFLSFSIASFEYKDLIRHLGNRSHFRRLGPNASIERTVSHGLGNVLGFDVVLAFEVGDGSGDAQYLVVGSG